jgi:hypothetical protein
MFVSHRKITFKVFQTYLNLNNPTPNFMVYAELGRYPLSITVKVRIFTFWAKMLYSNKLSNCAYVLLHKQNSSWINCVKNILDECGLSYVWQSQLFTNVSWLKHNVFTALFNQFTQSWISDVSSSSKGINYRIFKENLKLRNYLLKLPCKKYKLLCRFRCCNFKLPVETGRWEHISRSDRKCNLCDLHDIGDEFHHLFKCKYNVISHTRQTCLPRIYSTNPNVYKFSNLFSNSNVHV